MTDTNPSLTHSFEISGIQGYVNVGLDDTGRPFELFLTIQKEGSTIGGFADAFARLFSTALQSGVPLATLIRRMKGLRFEPLGLTSNKTIPSAESIPDYIAHWLEQTFP